MFTCGSQVWTERDVPRPLVGALCAGRQGAAGGAADSAGVHLKERGCAWAAAGTVVVRDDGDAVGLSNDHPTRATPPGWRLLESAGSVC
jgi:hypothetical protein